MYVHTLARRHACTLGAYNNQLPSAYTYCTYCTLPYLTLPVDVLVRTSGNNLSPDNLVLHARLNFTSAGAPSVLLQDVNKRFCLASSVSCPMRWFPENNFRHRLLFFLTDGVTCKLESSPPDDIGYLWMLSVQYFVGHVLFPADVEHFPKHPCVTAIE